MEKISWGILSTARIGIQKVIPAMQQGKISHIAAIASRSLENAIKASKALSIPKAYGSYEELLADKNIAAVYIPLPNHLHVEWALKSLEAGKHVLCEKPIGLNYNEAAEFYKHVQDYPHLKVMEAFMYRFHPQWQKAKELVREGAIGELKTIHSFFSYFNNDPDNIRNNADIGGGGLLDIGCYCLSVSRFLFNTEPLRVCSTIEYDPDMKIDRLVSGVLEYENGTSTFSCATQIVPFQRVFIYGTNGRIEIDIPFNAPADIPCRITLQTGQKTEEIKFDVCNQYTIQGDLFSSCIINDTPPPTPIEDAVANMKAIDRIITSHKTGTWVDV